MDYLYTVVILVSLYVVLATSFNLVIGYGGLVSIAHPIFYAIGAYGSALLAKDFGVPIVAALFAGAAIAAVASIVLALPSLRVSGDYLLIASIGFQLGVLEIIKNMSWTGGSGGLSSIPGILPAGSSRLLFVAVAVIVALLAAWFVRRIAHGPFGRALSAMRDDELAFAALGRNAMRIKVSTFALGSGLAGFAGALYAHYFRFVTPEQFGILASAAMLTMVVVGGLRSTWGPVGGRHPAASAAAADHLPQSSDSMAGPLQGLLFTGLVLVFMVMRPQGLVPAARVWSARTETGP